MSACYYLSDPADICIERLDVMTALYHRPSGQTHLVTDPVPQLLACLDSSPAAVEAIMSRLSETHELDSDEDAAAVVAARLEELASLGLIGKSGQ